MLHWRWRRNHHFAQFLRQDWKLAPSTCCLDRCRLLVERELELLRLWGLDLSADKIREGEAWRLRPYA